MTAPTLPSPVLTAPVSPAQDSTRAAKGCAQLDLPPRAMECLKILTRKTEATSCVEVVKNAVRLYAALIEATEAGKRFPVRGAAGLVSPYRLFL